VAALGDDVAAAAEAIRTTDLRTKLAFRELELGGKTVRFAAIAKGSGMIHPQMATMLCFITTDARVAPETLQRALVSAVDETFNTITVDGDMSTNDTVIALANGASGAPTIEPGSAADKTLEATLTASALIWPRRSPPTGRGPASCSSSTWRGCPSGRWRAIWPARWRAAAW
jgi:glutamate N-acetyltransferase/amino-acid N-acetyltransferase